ncbi:MAG TPA: hypothetical protein VKN36_00770 [Eudoraea sp.]|nr:hypothetical protein [Eudoraea sp.]
MTYTYIALFTLLSGCQNAKEVPFGEVMHDSPSIDGKKEYLNSPFVTPGNRVYMVGDQNGGFSEIGWHIIGEMGGIWNHPVKLMDGFQIDLLWEEEEYRLNRAHTFTNYPFTNRHSFTIEGRDISIERWQFVPDNKQGIVIQLVLKNEGSSNQDFNLKFLGNTDLRPTWLGERTQLTDHPDTAIYNEQLGSWVVQDSLNPWFAIFGADKAPVNHQGERSDYSGNGVSNSLMYPVSISSEGSETINFVIAGSYTSKEDALNTYTDILANANTYFNEKKARYNLLASQSRLTVPDKKLQQTFEWLKYNSDWMIQTVPEVGTGITAGIPDYPWWFGVDSEYALKGYMAIGQTEVVYETIQLLDSLSMATNGNGRIVHETSTNGAVFNKGNINETPQFASLIWEVYQWNGEIEFLKKYFPSIKKGLHWLLTENDANKNLFPDGFGMMEIHGLDSEMIDVAVYTQRAFGDAAKIAVELGENDLALRYEDKAATLKERINTEFWSEEFRSYADFIGTDRQALKLIDDAIVRADSLDKPWAVAELKNTRQFILVNPSAVARPFVLHHNWVVNTPMEMKIADTEKALKALNTAEKFVNPFGVFVTGIDRDESAGSDEGSFKGSKIFSYTGAVMTLPTGVQAVAENNYGRPDKALNYLQRMSRTFSYALPGSMYEVSPDYGMMTQAWNIYGFAVPIVQQFFGIQPQASKKKVWIRPRMPDEWPEASLENVIVQDNRISVFYSNAGGQLKLKVIQENPEWTVDIEFPRKRGDVTYEVVSGSSPVVKRENEFILSASDSIIDITLKLK